MQTYSVSCAKFQLAGGLQVTNKISAENGFSGNGISGNGLSGNGISGRVPFPLFPTAGGHSPVDAVRVGDLVPTVPTQTLTDTGLHLRSNHPAHRTLSIAASFMGARTGLWGEHNNNFVHPHRMSRLMKRQKLAP